MKHRMILIAAGALAVLLSGCTDAFLKEELVSTITQDYLDTEQGLEQMIVANYNAFRFDRQFFAGHFTHEGGHDMMTTFFEDDSYSGNSWNGNNTNWLAAAGAANGFLGEYSAAVLPWGVSPRIRPMRPSACPSRWSAVPGFITN